MLTILQKDQGPMRCNLLTQQAGYFYPMHHEFLMNSMGNPQHIVFLSTSPSVEWILQDVGIPIGVKKNGRILIHNVSFGTEHCLHIDMEMQRLLDQSSMPSQIPRSEHIVYAITPPAQASDSSTIAPSTSLAFASTAATLSATSLGADSAPLSFPKEPTQRPIRSIPFPLTYVCDMIFGLRFIMDLHGNSVLSHAFDDGFPGCQYGRSSLNGARNVVWHALEVGGDELVTKYIGYGRTPNGLWKTFREEVNGALHIYSISCFH